MAACMSALSRPVRLHVPQLRLSRSRQFLLPQELAFVQCQQGAISRWTMQQSRDVVLYGHIGLASSSMKRRVAHSGAHLEIEVTNCYARPLQGSVRRCREKVLAWRPFLRDCAPQGGEKAARKKVCRGSVARCEPEENRVRRSNKHGRDHRFPAKPRDPRIR